jgi:hypothetical protein
MKREAQKPLRKKGIKKVQESLKQVVAMFL